MTRLLPGLLLFLVACATSGALTPDRGPAIDALFADYTGDTVPGASVIVIRGGRVVFQQAYGMADLEHHTPARPTTDYRLASMTSSGFSIPSISGIVRRKSSSREYPLIRQ